jgi:ABC-type sugar transport system substrate-binding protein
MRISLPFRALAVATTLSLAVAGCSSTATTAPSAAPASAAPASAAPASAAPTDAAQAAMTPAWPAAGPYTTTLKDGSTFTLNPRIAAKVKSGEPINYVFSMQSSAVPIFSQQYELGYNKSVAEVQKTFPMNGQFIAPMAPSGLDVNGQIAQIEALLNTDKIDCLTMEPADSTAFVAITNKAMAMGIPVFIAGIISNGNEFQYYGQIPTVEGPTAGEAILKWMKDTGNNPKVFMVSGGDPTTYFEQNRMKGFRETIQAAIPDAKFITDETNALNVSFDAATALDRYKAFIAGHPDIQFILNGDISAEQAARAVKEAGLEGKAWVTGWNVSIGQLDAIDEGIQAAAFDQKWEDQAGFGAKACAALLTTGTILPNDQVLLPITKANSAEARAKLMEILEVTPAP